MAYKSYYNFIYKRNDDEWVMYNTLNSALVILSNCEKETYDKLPNENIDIHSSFEKELYSLGFILDDDYDEKGIVTNSRFRRMFIEKSAYLRILTTTLCNANCEYCYEKGFQPVNITMETAKQVVKFILEKSNVEILYLHWFGGEPLLNIQVIDYIMDNVYEKLKEKGVSIYVYITSNASLINNDLINKIKDNWHTNWIQITIDDLGAKYDKVKKYNPEQYNFQKVVRNIELLLNSEILVNLRINYDEKDIKKVSEVSEYFINKFKDYYISGMLRFTPAPIFDVMPISNKNSTSISNRSLGIYEAYTSILSQCNSKYDPFDLSFKGGQCYACHQGSFIIDPEGNLFKCTVTIKDKKTNVGSVYTGFKANREYFRWVSPTISEQCDKCIFLPICQGGCRAGHLGYINHCCNYYALDIEKILNYKIRIGITNKK